MSAAADVREQIDRCLLAYTRGVDRLDSELLETAFHPGATLDGYGASATTIEVFIGRLMPGLAAGFAATQHRLSNTAVEVHGDIARVESYVLALHLQSTDDGDKLITFSGRYIDDFTEVAGEWRIAHRRLRYDWSKIEDIAASMPGDWTPSARDRTDAIYDT